MKRKTNLFYLNGEETNFITFSNYGESLTGNFLATDWKLYPSRFICVYSKYLDTDDIVEFESRKEILTKYMARFYENKLAFLRDYYKDNNINVESDLKPLDYFLEALFRFNPATGDQKEIFWKEDETKRTPEESHPEYAHTEPESDDYLYISFVGDVTEMDYNGVYSDIISFIGSANTANGYVKHVQTDPMTVTYTEDTEHLYGWTLDGEWIGPEEYKTVQPLFDMDNLSEYTINSTCELVLDEHTDNKNIKFNLLIPLYDLVNNNINTNATILEDKQTSDDSYVKNVPLGIWFSNNVIDLKRDNLTHYAPSWSLLLSAQFKPFPYSSKMPNEITQDSTKEAFMTYSQVLTRQNKLLKQNEELSNKIVLLENNIKNLQTQLNHKSSYYVDDIQTREINFESRITSNMNDFKKEIYEYVKNIWKTDALV